MEEKVHRKSNADIKSIDDLTKIPFADRGRGNGGVDCWGCTMIAHKILTNKELPDFNVGAFNVGKIFAIINHQDEFGDWERVGGPSRGVILIIKNHPKFVNHTGVCIDDKHFIHSIEKANTVIEKIDHPLWKNRIHGYYRYTR